MMGANDKTLGEKSLAQLYMYYRMDVHQQTAGLKGRNRP